MASPFPSCHGRERSKVVKSGGMQFFSGEPESTVRRQRRPGQHPRSTMCSSRTVVKLASSPATVAASVDSLVCPFAFCVLQQDSAARRQGYISAVLSLPPPSSEPGTRLTTAVPQSHFVSIRLQQLASLPKPKGIRPLLLWQQPVPPPCHCASLFKSIILFHPSESCCKLIAANCQVDCCCHKVLFKISAFFVMARKMRMKLMQLL
ncbi:hypothetical protein BS78_01G381300 [Paspalum vaginatum]|nr:hypothetical protein BS78_01G381300 [Paspalum vaginatum]